MTQQTGNPPVDLTAGRLTMFVYCDFVQNEIGDTQTAPFTAVPLGDKRHRAFTRIQ